MIGFDLIVLLAAILSFMADSWTVGLAENLYTPNSRDESSALCLMMALV